MTPPTASAYLSATQRALLEAAREGIVFVQRLNPTNPDAITKVGWGGPRNHEFRPLGVRLALSAGYVTIADVGLPEHPAWRQLNLTPEGVAVLAASAARKPSQKGKRR